MTLLPSPNHSTHSHFSISCLALTKSPTRQLARSDARATYDAFNRQFIPPPSGSLLMLPDNSPNHSQLMVAPRTEALAARGCHPSMKSRTKSERTLDATSQSDAKKRSEWVLLAVFATWRRNSHQITRLPEALDPLGPKPSPNHPHAMQGAGSRNHQEKPSLQVTFGRTNGRRPKQMRPNRAHRDARSAVSAVHERSHRGNRYARDLPPAAAPHQITQGKLGHPHQITHFAITIGRWAPTIAPT